MLNSDHPYALLSSYDCRLGPYSGGEGGFRFDIRVSGSQTRITGIEICHTGFDSLSMVSAGFRLYIDGEQQPLIACNYDQSYPYGIIEFDDNEVVNRLDLYTYHQTLDVIGAITIYTNKATYGGLFLC